MKNKKKIVLMLLIFAMSVFVVITYQIKTLLSYFDIKKINPDFIISNLQTENNRDIFKDYYAIAKQKLNELSLDEKIGQLLITPYKSNILEESANYYLSGYLFFENDFKNKTKEEVITMINNLQSNANIPLLTAIDEEGGIVSRISSNENLVDAPFLSSQALYKNGGFNLIREDTLRKSAVLKELGLNLNFAPVVDVSTNKNDYIYKRTLGQDAPLTAAYAKTVIDASKGTGVSYTLKHFPGYGSNLDTHSGSSIDTRNYEELMSRDILPFTEGIKEGAEAVMISHNIVNCLDNENPASLSLNVHKLLRETLGFTGIIITDDIAMKATSNIKDAAVKSVLAGNNLIITRNYQKSFTEIKNAVLNKEIKEEVIDNLVLKVLAWKYYKGLFTN